MSIQNVYKTYISIGKVWHTFHILFIFSCEYIKRIAYLIVTYYILFVYVLYTRLFDISSGAGVESKTSVLELGRGECCWGDSKLKDVSLRSSDIV